MKNKFNNKAARHQWRIIALFCIFYLTLSGCASPYKKIYRVGILCGIDSLASTIDGFKAKMSELGYKEGQNILYDIQKTNIDPDGEKHMIERFIGEKVDLIFAFPHDAAITARDSTQKTDTPVIFAYANIDDEVFVNSLLEPGGNITGVQHPLKQLMVKRFEYLIEIDPTIERIWVGYDNSQPSFPHALEALKLAAQAKQITLVEVLVDSPDTIKADFEQREKSADIGIDAILLTPSPVLQTQESWDIIKVFAEKHNLPVSANIYEQIKDGAVFHLGNDYIDVGKKAATLADKILQGTPPSEIPVLSPEDYLRINLVRAITLGLNVPDGLLKQAAEIIR